MKKWIVKGNLKGLQMSNKCPKTKAYEAFTWTRWGCLLKVQVGIDQPFWTADLQSYNIVI